MPPNDMPDSNSIPTDPSEDRIEAVLEHAGAAWRRQAMDVLEAALPTLSTREEAVVHLTYYQEATDPDIAALLNLDASPDESGERRVHQLREAALDRLTDVTLPEATGEWSATRSRTAALLRRAGERWRKRSSASPPADALDAAAAVLEAASDRDVEDPAYRNLLFDDPALDNESSGGASPKDVPDSTSRAAPGTKAESSRTNDRPPVARSSAARWARIVGAVVGAVVVAYLSLWVVGRATVPETYSYASVEAYDDALTMRVRGGTDAAGQNEADGRNDAADRFFRAGADALLEAPTSTWGLFPRYDPDDAQRAVASFREAFRATDDPFRRARASFFLAKAHLMTGDVEAARQALQQVLDQNVAVYRSEAEALLRDLAS